MTRFRPTSAAVGPHGERPATPAPSAERRTPERVLDELLVTLAQAGDVQALDRLARRWRPRHYTLARRLLRDPDGAAEAVQDAWVSIVRGLAHVEDPARFPAWSYAVVTRRCRDLQRKRARAPLVDPDAKPPDPGPGPQESAADLRRALAALPPDQAAAVALFYGDGLSGAEIAEALGVPLGTVKTRLFHARRTLRRRLEGDPT